MHGRLNNERAGKNRLTAALEPIIDKKSAQQNAHQMHTNKKEKNYISKEDI